MAQPLTNPYTPGQVPRIFAGRVAELGRIRDQVSRVATFGELGGPLLVFHAPRGLGKTSLLRTAQRQAAELGLRVGLGRVLARPPVPARAGARGRAGPAPRRADASTPTRAGAGGARLERVSVELGVPGPEGHRRHPHRRRASRRASTASAAPIGALEDLLHDAAGLVRGRGGAGLLVFIDELHAASRRRPVDPAQRRCRTSTASARTTRSPWSPPACR